MAKLARLRWEAQDLFGRVVEELPGLRRGRRVPLPTTTPFVVVSPHLDDAVLSCGRALAGAPGAVVVTLFTGGPATWDHPTEWDRACGFGPGDDVMAVRKAEDGAALDVLGARPVWLDVVEGGYDDRVPRAELADALAAALDELAAPTVLVPLGLYQADHVRASDAALDVASGRPGTRWIAYDDLPYREQFPDRLPARLAELAARGIEVEPVAAPAVGPAGRKRAAMRRYVTQNRPLRGVLHLALRTEGYRRLVFPHAPYGEEERRVVSPN